MSIEKLDTMSKEQVLDFIRLVLIKPGATDLNDHYRFEMSGYESKTGECTVHNMFVLNKFAFLGIYDHTDFLFLDFYKGTPSLYLQYFCNGEMLIDTFGGFGTTEIIYMVLQKTIFSGLPTRRRS